MDTGQLRTILWLRWRLTRNQWSRSGPLNAAVTMFMAVVGLIVGVGGAIGGVMVGAFGLSKASPQVMLLVWDAIVCAFLFFWMIGLVTEIQRSEAIDISRLLHLPISLKDVFLVNYLASHLTLSIIVFLPGMLGLSLGLILGRSWSMLWLFPLVLSFVFMITAWTYCLRGWLITLMANKRRRRAIIAGITFAFILICQLPNLIGNVMADRKHHRPDRTESEQSEKQVTTQSESRERINIPNAVLVAHNYIPFLWVGNGVTSLASGYTWPAVWGSAGTLLIGGLGLRRAYKSTLRFYRGQAKIKISKRKPKSEKVTITSRNFLERQLPGLPDEAVAMGLTFFRLLARAPEAKMALATNFIMLVFFGVLILLRHSINIGDNFKSFIATGVVAFTFFGMLQLMFNQFGYDRSGFRVLVLSPVPRRYILLGKNLALLPIAAGIGIVLLVLVTFVLRIPIFFILAAGLQLVAAFFLLSMVGNLMSVVVPYRIAPGSLKPTKVPAMKTFLIFLSHSLFPTAMVPIFLPSLLGLLLSKLGWLSAASANFFLSVVLLVLIAFFYRISLHSLGNLLQRREKEILRVVTQEVE